MTFSVGQIATAADLNNVTPAAVATYTPSVSGGGTATFTTLTGWYYTVGSSMVFFTAYFVVNVGGSGSSTVTITAPTSIYRGTRQIVPANSDTLIGGGSNPDANGYARSATSGSGATWDKIILSGTTSTYAHSALIGSDLGAGGILTVTGWYRQS